MTAATDLRAEALRVVVLARAPLTWTQITQAVALIHPTAPAARVRTAIDHELKRLVRAGLVAASWVGKGATYQVTADGLAEYRRRVERQALGLSPDFSLPRGRAKGQALSIDQRFAVLQALDASPFPMTAAQIMHAAKTTRSKTYVDLEEFIGAGWALKVEGRYPFAYAITPAGKAALQNRLKHRVGGRALQGSVEPLVLAALDRMEEVEPGALALELGLSAASVMRVLLKHWRNGALLRREVPRRAGKPMTLYKRR